MVNGGARWGNKGRPPMLGNCNNVTVCLSSSGGVKGGGRFGNKVNLPKAHPCPSIAVVLFGRDLHPRVMGMVGWAQVGWVGGGEPGYSNHCCSPGNLTATQCLLPVSSLLQGLLHQQYKWEPGQVLGPVCPALQRQVGQAPRWACLSLLTPGLGIWNPGVG